MTSRTEVFAAAAEAQVGAPFRLHGRSPETGFDCVGLVLHALDGEGFLLPKIPTYNLRNANYDFVSRLAESCGFHTVSGSIIRGDLVAVKPGPGQLHLLIACSADRFVHAHAGLRRVVAATRSIDGPAGWPMLHQFRLSKKV